MEWYRAFSNWVWAGLSRFQGLQSPAPLAPDNYVSPPVGFDGAMQLSAVWACVKLLSETFGSLPVNVYRVGPDGRTRDTSHPLARLFAGKVNAYQTRIEFFETMALNLVMTGNAYAAIDRIGGNVVALLPLMSAQVNVRLLADGTVVYEYNNAAAVRVYASESIWHLKLMGNGIIGLSPLDYQRDTLNIAKGAERATGKVYANGGKPSGVIMFDRLLNPQQRDQIRANFNGLTEGDSSRLFVLENGAKFEAVSLSPQDIELLASRKYNVEEICRWYGVPSVMVNHTNGTTWGSGIQTIIEGFYKLVLLPMAQKFELSAEVKLLRPDERGTIEIDFEFDELLRADLKARMEAYAQGINAGVLKPSEARMREGLPADDSADNLMIQGAMVPISTLVPKPVEDSEATGGLASDVQQTALNGAQVASMSSIVQLVAQGQMPPDTAAAVIRASFPLLSPQQVDDIINPLRSFTAPTQSTPSVPA